MIMNYNSEQETTAVEDDDRRLNTSLQMAIG